ncbi:protein kinase activating protein dpb11 [Sporothrix bragantina]|uniref:Protein kinase activating protein dpb11 n=1 Tax=Sporothrix bragantina TaxID=671064 RepID=A0ABP0ARI9_9PEZI
MEALPFAGVVLCCTSIPVDLRDDLAKKVTELGGVHKPDLTHEVTHLIVGDYDTPKYRHVARDRPDIKPMCIGWVDAILDLWTRDAPIDLPALEDAWRLRTFEVHGGLPGQTGRDDGEGGAGENKAPVERGRLLCSVTGFEEEDRQAVIAMIVENGGVYSGDLTRSVTHLIVNKPEGKKYNAALHWNVQTVGIEWLHDSVARGMILDETKYDPRLPPSERGKGAWVRNATERTASILGKRLREAAAQAAAEKQNGMRKLRKTASQKLSIQRDGLWGDILGKPAEPAARAAATTTAQTTAAQAQKPSPSDNGPAAVPSRSVNDTNAQPPPQKPAPKASGGVLSTSVFCIHGFSPERTNVLAGAVATMGGVIASSLAEMAVIATSRPDAPLYQHVIVPQDQRPDAHPTVSGDVLLVTEFFIEQCLHKKQYPLPGGPSTTHARQGNPGTIGRPFPKFPIPGFDALSVCSSGFTGVDLNQVDKTIRQLGAKYEERFTAQCSVLIVTSLPAVRKQKLELALQWKVPVVDPKWLQTCIASGTLVPVGAYLFPQLRQNPSSLSGPAVRPQPPPSKPLEPRADAEADPEPTMALTVPTLVVGSPRTLHSADPALNLPPARDNGNEDLDATAQTAPYETAPSHQEVPLFALVGDKPATKATKENDPMTSSAVPSASNRPLVHNPFRSDSDSPPPRRPSPPAQQPALQPQAKLQLQKEARQPLNRVLSEIADSAAGDDSDDALSEDGAGAGARSNKVSPLKQIRQQAQANIMERSATANATSAPPLTTKPPRPALSRVLSDGLASAVTHQHHPAIPLGISIGDLMKDGGGGPSKLQQQNHAHLPDLNTRRSGGFGRTYSSVSGMSVPANDGHGMAALIPGGGGDDDDDTASLPPTQAQLQYLDPEAERIREQLMRKILGGAAAADSSSVIDARPSAASREMHFGDGADAAQRSGTAEEALAEARQHVRRSSRLR